MKLISTVLFTVMGAVLLVPSTANASDPYPYEVSVYWSMDSPDMSSHTSIEWPQTYYGDTAPPVESCNGGKFQHDFYYIRDDADRGHLARIIEDGINSPSDDASLEPHNWSVIYQAPNTSLCTPTPVHKKAWFHVTRYCNKVVVEGKHNAKVVVAHHNKRYVFHGTAVGNATFKNGKSHLTKVRYLKRTGCGSLS